MELIHKPGSTRTHVIGSGGLPLCGARLVGSLERTELGGKPRCPACRAVLSDRKRRRERLEASTSIDPFVQIKLSRNSHGNAQWEITVPYGSTQRELDEVHGLALDEYRRLEWELAFGKVAES